MLQIHNSLTGRKEVFRPITEGQVGLYVCGMTVYDYCHLGHARAMVVFDVVYRYLRWLGYQVTFVRNITDIDDKIIKRAEELGEPMSAVTRRFTDAMYEDADAMGCLRPDREPCATDNVEAMQSLIKRLIERGYAYATASGDVYFAVSEFPDYGKLSGERLDELRAGARIEPGEAKADAADFALWKAAKPGEPGWPSPWGEGRPGWHIECSAMATNELGEHFDIHGGGLDLKFPHHENEIAQSEAACGHDWVNYWMHNGHVRIDGEKMAKSLGNFFTVRDILNQYPAEVVRYFLVASHYRGPLNYTLEALDNARGGLERFYRALRGLPPAEPAGGEAEARRFHDAMADDFNTPEALAVLFDLAREVNRCRESGDQAAAAGLGARLRELAGVLGLLRDDPEAFLKAGSGAGGLDDERVDALVAERNEARARKDFQRADAIRDQLQDEGIILEDGPNGTSWRRG